MRSTLLLAFVLSVILHGWALIADSPWSAQPAIKPPKVGESLSVHLLPEGTAARQNMPQMPQRERKKVAANAVLPVAAAATAEPSPLAVPVPVARTADKNAPPPLGPTASEPARHGLPEAPPEALELPIFNAAYLSNRPPEYPRSARRRGVEGTVMVEARIGPAGEVREVKLAASAGDMLLDDAALEAVRGWRFEPARRGTRAVEAWVKIPLAFRLN